MESSITFENVYFLPSTIKEARKLLVEKIPSEYSRYLHTIFRITFKDGQEWVYDSEEEFWQGYRSEKMESCTFSYSAEEYSFWLYYAKYNKGTRVKVGARSTPEILGIFEIFHSAVPPQDTIEQPQLLKATSSLQPSGNVIETHPTYSIKQTLPSCDINIGLICDVENLIIRETTRITNEDISKIQSNFSIEIRASESKHNFRSIKQHTDSEFEDGVERITLHLYYLSSDQKISIWVTFAKDKLFSEISIDSSLAGNNYTFSHGVLAAIIQRLRKSRNANHLLHPNTFIYFAILLPIQFLCIALLFTMIFSHKTIISNAFELGITLINYCFAMYQLASFFKPYSSFDTNAQKNKDKWFKAAVATISTIFLGLIVNFISDALK